MDKLINLLQNNQHLTGHQETVYQCSNGCILSEEMLVVIYLSHITIKRCPYCNSNKLKRIE